MEALIQCTSKSSKMKEVRLDITKFCNDEEGQEMGVQLVEIIRSSNNIEKLFSWNTEVIGLNNLNQLVLDSVII